MPVLTELLYLLLYLPINPDKINTSMLRKLAPIVLFLLMNIAVSAQFKKGDKMVGASVGSMFFNHGNTNISTNVTISNQKPISCNRRMVSRMGCKRPPSSR